MSHHTLSHSILAERIVTSSSEDLLQRWTKIAHLNLPVAHVLHQKNLSSRREMTSGKEKHDILVISSLLEEETPRTIFALFPHITEPCGSAVRACRFMS